MHVDGGRPGLRLRLRDAIRLVREPENAFDVNAVAVIGPWGENIGYLPRQLARHIAASVDVNGVVPMAIVTGLRSDPAGRATGVTVALQIADDLMWDHAGGLEFSCEQGEEGAVYILLACDSALLDEVQDGLARRGFGCERSGQAFRPASDGNAYDWYIRMAEGVAKEDIIAYFAEAHGAALWRPASAELVDEYTTAFDGEIAVRDVEIARLEAALQLEHEQAGQARQAQGQIAGAALKSLVAVFLPQVEFVRDSWDVLSMEIAEPEGVLRELHAICCSPAEIRAKAVKGTRDWKELHFNTGQRDNGRLYFRQSDRTWHALISFKGSQEKDIDYLRKH
jgi:hypothetical protein